MPKRYTLGAMLALGVGLILLVSSGLGFLAAAAQRDDAEKSWRRQQEAHTAFHRTADEVSRKLQVGEIDNAAWTREVEGFSTQFKTDSEAAGKAWVDQNESVSRLRIQSSKVLAAGLFVVILGMVACVRSVRTAASSVTVRNEDTQD